MIRTRTIKTYAKINLYLDITGRREDGYHDIQSIMQQISLFDYVTVMKRDALPGMRRIALSCTDSSIPTGEGNIAFRCAKAYFETQGIADYNISIHIDKRIPVSAGLAGGSTDGAAVLKMLPILFDRRTTRDELCQIGAGVGADIPFCLVGGTCLAGGIGERLIPMARGFTCPILIAIGNESVSTAEAYHNLDARYGARFAKAHAEETEVFADWMNSTEVPKDLYNIFESVILPTHQEAAAIRREMLAYGAKASLMSGSGPSVFGLFPSESDLDAACDHFNECGIRAYKCHFVN